MESRMNAEELRQAADAAKQRIEQEARELVDEQVLPDPNSDPEEEVVEGEIVEQVTCACGGCQEAYQFNISPATQTFKFECQKCGTKNEWARLP